VADAHYSTGRHQVCAVIQPVIYHTLYCVSSNPVFVNVLWRTSCAVQILIVTVSTCTAHVSIPARCTQLLHATLPTLPQGAPGVVRAVPRCRNQRRGQLVHLGRRPVRQARAR
jgi:hypothetical protein